LEAFLNGAEPPSCRSRSAIADVLDQPSSDRALHWLMDNGLIAERVVPASLPIAMAGHHGYGHSGFNGYCLTPEARDVVRNVFGTEVWITD
jgi:hypothetical protein